MMAEFTRENIEKTVKKAVADASGLLESDLTGSSELIGQLNLDSLAIFELVIDLEEAYSLKIPDEDIDQIKTIDDAIDYIVKATS
jgi:acyl carrier protein